MSHTIPLDDEIGRAFYHDGAPWKLTYDPRIRGFALRRIAPTIAFDRALRLIMSGDLLWHPPATSIPPGRNATVESVRQHVELLEAYRQSPACMDSTDWSLRVRIDEQLAEARTWLSRRGLKPGSPSDSIDSEAE
jgi:hypothetical protein